MILTHVCGTLSDAAYAGKAVDPLQLDYADAQKHLLRRTTRGGRDIALRLLPEAQLRGLHDGDVLLEDGDTVVAVEILPVLSLLARPEGNAAIARFCYEVGNRHAPLYELEGPASGCLYFAVLYDAAMEDLFHKLQVPYEKKEIKLEERCRLKLLSGTHHHASSHRDGGAASAEGEGNHA